MSAPRETTLAVVLVVLAGCSGINGSTGASPSPSGDDTPAPTSEPTPTWTDPKTPLKPTEDKSEPGRIKRVRFVDTVRAQNGSGYTDFDIEVGADTRFPDVDSDSDGEPYFIVEVNGELVERTEVLPFRENGIFPIRIKQAVLDRFDSVTLEVRITLMEEDSHYADITTPGRERSSTPPSERSADVTRSPRPKEGGEAVRPGERGPPDRSHTGGETDTPDRSAAATREGRDDGGRA